MKSERLMGILSTLPIRSAPLLALCVCTTAALAATLHWRQTNTALAGRAPFTLVGNPASRTVTAGGIARFTVVIQRPQFKGNIKLWFAPVALLSRLGVRLGNRGSITFRGSTAVVAIKTASVDRPGSYRVKIKAAGGPYRGYLMFGLRVIAPRPASFRIAGSFGPLWPGTAQSIDLALTNPNPRAISVRRLGVSIKQVTAPRASALLPCSATDFAVVPFSGTYPLKLPAHATVRLSDLGVLAAQAPQLLMLDRPVNQDGCQGASVTLSYSGQATSP